VEVVEDHLQAGVWSPFPRAEDLIRFEQRAQCKEALASQLQEFQLTLDAQQRLLTQWEYVSHQLALSEQHFPCEHQEALREEYELVQHERSTRMAHLEEAARSLEQLEHDLHCQAARVHDGEQALGALAQQRAVLQRECAYVEASLAERQAALPAAWRLVLTQASTQNPIQLSQRLLEAGRQEYEALSEAPERLTRLVTARQDQQAARLRMAELALAREQTPVEARRSLEELDQERWHVSQDYERYEQEHQRLLGGEKRS
jgi:hypothetical protein